MPASDDRSAVPSARRDAGFTLIELLVVVVIIGILAAIAIPVFLGQRDQALGASVASAVANARISLVAEMTDGTWPDQATRDALLDAHGDPEITLVLTGNRDGFCIQGDHAQLSRSWAADDREGVVVEATCSAAGRVVRD
ncbi:type II secretion system protein [Microcella sp.]|uniref:type II secretion system protein n=1 Tax=Microcella sp. TaxID=1913979 RepID=UPI003918CCC8